MPIREIYLCDECGKVIEEPNNYIIYGLDFWCMKTNKPKQITFIDALMFCSDKCVGKYLKFVIEKGEVK